MNIFRNVIAVITGYAIFVVSAVLLFQVSGIDPHADPSIVFIVISIVYGAVFSFAGGVLTQLISKTGTLAVNYILAGILAGFAAFSLFKTTGNHYSQLAAIFLFAPASVSGGWMFLRRKKQSL